MGGFPADAPIEKVIRAFELLGFHLVRRGNHIAFLLISLLWGGTSRNAVEIMN